MNADRVKCAVVSAPGTGTISLGAAAAGFQTFTAAFPASGTVEYAILDGGAWETGVGTFNRTNNTLTRGYLDSSTKALISATAAAVVICTATASRYIPDWPNLVVGRQAIGTGNTAQFQEMGQGFTTVNLTVAPQVDTHGTWDQAAAEWVVPPGQSGVYDLQGVVRPNDSAPDRMSFGVGVDVANQDSEGFAWSTTVADYKASAPTTSGQGVNGRYRGYNSRQMYLSSGQRLRLFAYFDFNAGIGILNALLIATRIR